jgi:UDPglucose 6-dehydrogenase
MIISVVGMGYVGLVTGACLASFGHKVFCYDRDPAKIESLKKKIVPVYEKGMKELVEANVDSGQLLFTSSPNPAFRISDVIIIAVGTPALKTGEPDLSSFFSATRQIGESLDPERFTVVVTKSTVPVGTWSKLASILGSQRGGHSHFGVVSNPEFLREGNALWDTVYPDRIVIGACCQRSVKVIRDLYRPIIEQSFGNLPGIPPRPGHLKRVELIVTTPVNAEMIKYAANVFLATKISLINEIANICERVGADVTVVSRGVGLDHRIGPEFLKAGIGWGGSCFGKDLASILHTAGKYGYFPQIIDAAVQVNTRQRQKIVLDLEDLLGDLGGRTIGILGLSFKPNTNDLRDAPSLDIISGLLEKGAVVKVYDPVAMDECKRQHPELTVTYEYSAIKAASNADALVIVTEWEEFRNLDLKQLKGVMKQAVIVDGRNIFAPRAIRKEGFIYKGIGRPDK